VYTAALEMAHRLGFFEGVEARVRIRPGAWKDAPERKEGSVKTRFTLTIHPLHLQTIERAAQGADVSLQLFLVGSTLRYLANRTKSAMEAAEQPDATPEQKRLAKALSRIELPEQYQPR